MKGKIYRLERKEYKDPATGINVIKVTDNKANIEILCEHNSSGRKHAHVHPVFTPDDRYIIYSSDCDGQLNIYLAEVDRNKTIRG